MVDNWKILITTPNISRFGIKNIYMPLLSNFITVLKEQNITIPYALENEINLICPEHELVHYLKDNNIRPIAYTPL